MWGFKRKWKLNYSRRLRAAMAACPEIKALIRGRQNTLWRQEWQARYGGNTKERRSATARALGAAREEGVFDRYAALLIVVAFDDKDHTTRHFALSVMLDMMRYLKREEGRLDALNQGDADKLIEAMRQARSIILEEEGQTLRRRKEEIDRISDRTALLHVTKTERDMYVSAWADKRLHELSVKEVSSITDIKALEEIASNDPVPHMQQEAKLRLREIYLKMMPAVTDIQQLKAIAQLSEDAELANEAMQRRKEAYGGAYLFDDPLIRKAARLRLSEVLCAGIEKTGRQEDWIEVAMTSENPEMRKAAIRHITNKAVLSKLYGDPHKGVRKAVETQFKALKQQNAGSD
jgi:hypothetical protein